jgi:hypothetical protein
MKAGVVGWVKGSCWFGSWVGRNIVRLIQMTNNSHQPFTNIFINFGVISSWMSEIRWVVAGVYNSSYMD